MPRMAGVAAHRPRLRLVEARGLAGAPLRDDVVVAAGLSHLDKLVVVADLDGDDAVRLDRRVVGGELGLLDLALLGGEDQVAALGEVAGVMTASTRWFSRSGRKLLSERPLAVRAASGSS